MIQSRREAPHRSLVPLLVLLLLAGCSHGPKPRADVPADTTRAVGREGTARRPGAAGTRNGTSVSGAKAGSSTTSPAVVPQLSAAEQERLERETRAAMDLAQKALDAIDVAKLDVERNRKFLIATDFLAQAGEARTRKEYEKAQGLALKARLLAEGIAAR